MERIKEALKLIILVLTTGCLLLAICSLCNEYSATRYKSQMAYNEMKASEYKMNAEDFRMQTIKMHLDIEEAKLKVFLKQYGGEE